MIAIRPLITATIIALLTPCFGACSSAESADAASEDVREVESKLPRGSWSASCDWVEDNSDWFCAYCARKGSTSRDHYTCYRHPYTCTNGFNNCNGKLSCSSKC